MRTLLILAILASLSAAPATAQDATITVRLVVDAAGAATLRDCTVTIEDGQTAADVLDAALDAGCIGEWSGTEYPGYGRFVDSIDHVRGALATYWQLQVNGVPSSRGVDTTFPADGDVVTFSYAEGVTTTAFWLVDEFVTPLLP